MSVAKLIRNRRRELGLSDAAIAAKLGLTVAALGDIELHDDELETAVPLGTVRRLCMELGLSLSEVLTLPATGSARTDRISANKLLRQTREQKGYTELDLGDRVGFDEDTIKALEAKAAFAETLPVFLFRELERALTLPEGTLLLGRWE
jgi:transcriptional regulator with XRE-family HTH domain